MKNCKQKVLFLSCLIFASLLIAGKPSPDDRKSFNEKFRGKQVKMTKSLVGRDKMGVHVEIPEGSRVVINSFIPLLNNIDINYGERLVDVTLPKDKDLMEWANEVFAIEGKSSPGIQTEQGAEKPSEVQPARSSYVKEGSIGSPTRPNCPSSEDIFRYRPMECWIGESFLFLPKPKSLQEYGYQSIKGADGRFGNPSYEKFVGRQAKVIMIEGQKVTFKMEDDGTILTAEAYSESIDGIAPILDIDNASKRWTGKKLWYIKKDIATFDSTNEKFGSIKVKRYSPVTVKEVIAGWYDHEPVRFVLSTSTGEEGFIDVDLSGTNVSPILRNHSRFEQYFLEEDPRKIHNWPENVWKSIEEEKVFIGMTKEQAIFSWGKPQSVNNTIVPGGKSEQWVYGDTGPFIYFENGKLTSIQN